MYHINLKGNPGKCTAQYNCPFGGIDEGHFQTPEHARAAFEKVMEDSVKNPLKKDFTPTVKDFSTLKNVRFDETGYERAMKKASEATSKGKYAVVTRIVAGNLEKQDTPFTEDQFQDSGEYYDAYKNWQAQAYDLDGGFRDHIEFGQERWDVQVFDAEHNARLHSDKVEDGRVFNYGALSNNKREGIRHPATFNDRAFEYSEAVYLTPSSSVKNSQKITDAEFEKGATGLSKTQAAFAKRVIEGKKVTAEQLDEWMHSAKEAQYALETKVNPTDEDVALNKIYMQVRAARKAIGEGTTIPDVSKFDPSQKTIFGSARGDANKMSRAIARTLKEYETLDNTAKGYSSAKPKSNDPKEVESLKAQERLHRELADSAKSKYVAMLKEMKYLSDKDPSLRKELGEKKVSSMESELRSNLSLSVIRRVAGLKPVK